MISGVSHVSVPMMTSGLTLSITFASLHCLMLMDLKLMFTILSGHLFCCFDFLVGVDVCRGLVDLGLGKDGSGRVVGVKLVVSESTGYGLLWNCSLGY